MTGILCSLPMMGAPTNATSGTPTYTVTLNKSSVSGSGTTDSITTSSSVTATASGAESPYIYKWEKVSGDNGIAPTNGNSATTSFSRNNCVGGSSYSAQWRCRAEDATGTSGGGGGGGGGSQGGGGGSTPGAYAYSSNVSITITRTGSGGGGGGGSSGGTFNGIANITATNIGVASSKTASYAIHGDGSITASGASPPDWNSDSGVGSSYEVKATNKSGPISGTFDTWQALSSNRSWSITDSTQDDVAVTGSMTLKIRLVGTTSDLDSATITFTANALNTL